MSQIQLLGLKLQPSQLPVDHDLSTSTGFVAPLTTDSGLEVGDIFRLDGSLRAMVCLKCSHCQKLFARTHSQFVSDWKKRGSRPPKNLFCSMECSQGEHTKLKITCPLCGGVKAAHAKECQDCYAEKQQRKNVVLECGNCGKKFLRTKSEYEKGQRRYGTTVVYCGHDCYRQHRLLNPIVRITQRDICPVCHGPVHRAGRKYCSRACYAQAKTKAVPAGYQAYRGEWLSAKTQRLEHDRVCRVCLAVSALEVHHIDHDAANHEVGNLLTLCRKCHNSYHNATETERAILQGVFKVLALK